MKHTPGPWYWDSEGLGSKDVLVFGKGYPFEMTSKANKQLIAAAPDLLEALKAAMDYIDAIPRDIVLPAMPGFDRDWVDGVISKALGEE